MKRRLPLLALAAHHLPARRWMIIVGRVLFLLGVAGLVRAQTLTLDNFNNPGATGGVVAGPPPASWGGNVTRNATSITVGGTARDDNGWGVSGLALNATNMTHVTLVAQRDAGHTAPSVVVQLVDAALNVHTLSVPAANFASGALTTVNIPIGSWPAGFNPAQIAGWTIGGGTAPPGLADFRMTFEHLSFTGDAPPEPPTVTVQPADRAIGIGTSTTLTVTATSTSGPLRYQWRKDGTAIEGSTQPALAIGGAALDRAGTYRVDVSNDAGTTPSRDARLVVLDARPTHALAAGRAGYLAGDTLSITNQLLYGGTAATLRWSVLLPAGWSLAAQTATGATLVQSTTPDGLLLEWTWATVPATPLTFDYTVNIPAGTEQDRVLAALITFTQNGVSGDILVTPDPFIIHDLNSRHSADTDADFRLSLVELTRVIELYNTRNGTVRTGAYDRASVATEDGFVADPSRSPATVAALTRFHAADADRNGRLDLVELSRVIALYNYREGTLRTGRYHLDSSTEDGFAPGP